MVVFELLKRIICKSCLTAEEYKKLIEFFRQYSFNNLDVNQLSVASTIIEHSFKEFKFKESIFLSMLLILHSVFINFNVSFATSTFFFPYRLN